MAKILPNNCPEKYQVNILSNAVLLPNIYEIFFKYLPHSHLGHAPVNVLDLHIVN